MRHTSRSAPRLKLTFWTTLTSWASVADVCSATFVAGSYGAVGSAASGLGPVGAAVTVTPARPSASMNPVRAHADGSSTR